MTVRTRYAPSPTGYLHVGGLRTALYNYLYARQNGGAVILRIEDTDQTRRVEGAVENLISVFAWLGLSFDEGPHTHGSFGPYVQSERLALYREHVTRLAQSGHAYPCFCTPEILEEIRTAQAAQGRIPMYDRRCRTISGNGAAKRIASGEPHVWRMAVPGKRTVNVRDLIRGDVSFDTSTVDDQVLLKSDGFPTYHLANVVDDHSMQISHVIRGEEWLPSTPKHVLLYEFFGWEPPQWAHLPLLLNPDRSKMSKRSGDVAVEAYRNKGILPEVLINYVALLGWHPSDDREIFSIHDLIREFSIERVGKAGAIFDQTKLVWMNTEYIKAESDELLLDHVRNELSDLIESIGEERVKYAINVLRGGADSYEEMSRRVREVFAPVDEMEPEMATLLEEEHARTVIGDVKTRLATLPHEIWTQFETIEASFKTCVQESGHAHGMKGKNLWRAVRAALTGKQHGPELAKLMGIWGRDRVLTELNRSLTSERGSVSA